MPDPLSKLPPLDLVRGFVAVARRMSFTHAAEDLFVTQSAISRQVKNLEEFLGTSLVIRKHRAIELTDDGMRLFRCADGWLQQLAEVTASMRRADERRPVTITASLGVTSLWLVPRLGEFQSSHPSIDVRVAASNKIVNLEQDDMDLAIRYCRNALVPPGAIRLFGETLVPVAHPSLKIKDIESTSALAKNILLDLDEPQRPWLQWSDWLSAGQLDKVKPKGVLRFNQYDQVIHAALAGHGIALGRMALVQPMLQQGRLVAVGKRTGQVDHFAYWLIMRSGQMRAEVHEFAEWIMQEARLANEALA
ncbi:LysR substrate-binding domain-containing protein [Undibacterium terreum]|uniref:LysR family transcriptional regulator n=1 Tax=Undibacterium terreum TaxID=1224302 RepID=A0A916UCC0_9BURK|nr:LysR substrate-binding domain-containing protein [Undibacterium terreum]GGC68468.1 LysR family transcriptional regulator [Undibacterium terreum]